MSQRIEIVRGTTNTFEINIVDSSGAPYNLGSGEKVVFGIKKKPEHTEVIFAKVGEIVYEGKYSVVLDPADTEDLPSGDYYFDVAIESGEAFHNVIEPSPFKIVANITSRGCTE